MVAYALGHRGLTERTGTGKMEAMNREQVLAALRDHEPSLKAAGVVRLSLFGFTARGDRRPGVEEGTLKPRVQKSVEAEALRAF